MATDCPQQLTFWDLGLQQVAVAFDGGRVVTDAGLLLLQLLDKQLGVLSTIVQRLPDLVSPFGDVAASVFVCCGLSGGV